MNAQTQNMPAQSPAKAFQVYMNKYKSQLEMALPKHLTADRMMRLSLTEFSKNPKLQECTHNTIFGSIVTASQLGLEIGVNGQGYLVPYWNNKKNVNECQFIPGWKGLVDLAQRGGRASVWTGAVYEGDEFDYMLGDSPYCRHKPCGEFDEAKLTHVYAIGRVKDSEMPVIEVWPVKKVNMHFEKTVTPSLKKYHYSKKHFEAYAKKVALLQVLKYMPQSIELSNAMEVSGAVEAGKSVTIEGDFVTVENTPQEDIQQTDTVNETYQEQLEAPKEQIKADEETDYAPTFAQIKKGILTAKSPAHLDVMEEQAMDHADKDERKQLMTLIKAQAVKFQPAKEVAPTKKPEPVKEQSPPVENVVEVKITARPSDDVRKDFSSRLNKAKNKAELNELHEMFVIDQQLTGEHVEYLKEVYTQCKAKFDVSKVEPTKSSLIQGGLLTNINVAKTIEELEAVAKSITNSKASLLPEHHQELLTAYAQRKEIVSQADIFDVVDQPAVSYVDAVIARIQSAESQDDINAEYADPAIEELSDQDRQKIDLAAGKREQELQQG